MEENKKQKANITNDPLPLEVHLTYDKSDGEVFCAFIDKDECEREAKESGCGMQTVRLIWK